MEMGTSLGCACSEVRICQLLVRGGHRMGLGHLGALPRGTEILIQAIKLGLERKRLLVSMTMNQGCAGASSALAGVRERGGSEAVGSEGWLR